MDSESTNTDVSRSDLSARIAAARVRRDERVEQDRIRREKASLPEELGRVERLRKESRTERQRLGQEVEETARRVATHRNYEAEAQLRRIESGHPHDGHPLDPDWDRL